MLTDDLKRIANLEDTLERTRAANTAREAELVETGHQALLKLDAAEGTVRDLVEQLEKADHRIDDLEHATLARTRERDRYKALHAKAAKLLQTAVRALGGDV